jgi:hypothetical protein
MMSRTENVARMKQMKNAYKIIVWAPEDRNRDSAVSIVTVYGLDDRGVGVRVPVGSGMFSSRHRPDRFWGPQSLLSNGYRGLFPRVYSGRGVKVTTHLHLVPRSRKRGSIHPLPHTPSWRSVYLVKHRQNFTFTLHLRRRGRVKDLVVDKKI